MSKISFQQLKDKESWEGFSTSHSQANFLQSYNWGLFHASLGHEFFPIAILLNKEQIGAAMIIKERAKRGDYLTIAGGPLLDWQHADIQEVFARFCKYLQQLARQEKTHFVRIRTQEDDSPQLRQLFMANKLQPSPMHLTADLTLRLDLTLTEDELLAQMRKNTRYEVRKAQRIGITTKILTDPSFINQFYQHQLYLAEKHQFVPFSQNFLLKQFESFISDNQVCFVNSYHQDKLLASAFVIFYGEEAVYHYGVSTERNEKLPGSYAVQWAAIQEAKKRGCKEYNFWGVSPLDNPDHRFAGPSLFKRGFGGYEVKHLPAHDLPTSPLYLAIKAFELIRKKTRKL